MKRKDKSRICRWPADATPQTGRPAVDNSFGGVIDDSPTTVLAPHYSAPWNSQEPI